VAARLDVATRLAEGRTAAEHTQVYVRACQALGYEHPDLTAHPSQVRDWYDSEEGLDLHALDADCAELRAAAGAVTEALRMQRDQVGELAAAWAGSAADPAVRFLQRHCDAADAVAGELRAAAQRCEALRDNLWHLLDVKVATAIAIDDRSGAQRPAWLAAAEAVTTGVGDRPTAEELVVQQVKPYVDNDIRDEWLSAMRSAQAGVAASYDMVTDRLATAPHGYFEVPGDLGPVRPRLQPVPIAPPGPAAVAPAAFTQPAAAPAPAPTAPATATPPMPAVPDMGTGLGGTPALPTGAGGLGGLGGLASRIVEAMGSVLGSAAEQPTDPLDVEDPRDLRDDDADEGPAEPADKQADEAQHAVHDLPVERPPAVDGPPAAAPIAAPTPVAPPVTAPPSIAQPSPPLQRSTPCEIAADELPHAGP
jgi:hypothetical protein